MTPDPQEQPRPSRRPPFTKWHLELAEKAGFITKAERVGRRKMTTYPIDDLPPEQLSDRDDGIFIEAREKDEGYRVHITIADVAAHIRPFTTLANAAAQRGFTAYRPGGNSTMFPQELQDRMSLEDRQERLGLTITIDLDKNFHPIHTEFQRVIADIHATSYQQARAKMDTDPQFQLMAKIATGIRENYFGNQFDALQTIDARPRSPNATDYQIAATKAVETFMLLANSESPKVLKNADIPFMNRNFDQGGTKAYYSTDVNGHTDLQKRGIKYYCQVTSPIRRAPDFFNQHQMHFAINVIEEAEEGLLAIDPTLSKAHLHYHLWRNEEKLINLVANHSTDLASIETALLHIAKKLGSTLPEQDLHQQTKQLALRVDSWKPPYTTNDLDEAAQHINDLMHVERTETNKIARTEASISGAERRLEQLSDKTIREVQPNDFSQLLHDAALTGKLPKPLLEETHRRINGIGEHRLNPVRDGLQIMIVAAYPTDRSWISLKKGMARLIKHDPATVNGILDLAIRTPDALRGGVLLVHEASLPTQGGSPHKPRSHIQSALVTYQTAEDAPMMSAPYYSIGHDKRSALSHAKYSFLEHFAFGQLRPVDQISMPNPLYAELDKNEQSRRPLVEKMVKKLHAHIHTEFYKRDEDTIGITLGVSGGKLKLPIKIQAHASTQEEAEATAMRKLLRHNQFKTAGSSSITDMDRMLNPHHMLKKLEAEHNGLLTLETEEIPARQKYPTQFRAHYVLTLPSKKPESAPIVIDQEAVEPNKDRAIRTAAEQVLSTLETDHGWVVSPLLANLPEQHVSSWVRTVTAADERDNTQSHEK